MAIVNRSFSVNVTPGMMPPIVHVSEYDVGRAYTVSILDEQGNTFTIPSGTTASIEGTLNGSVGFTKSATVSNNQVLFTLSQDMTAYSGKAWCKIKLTLNNQPIQTCAFILAVDRAGVEVETVIGAPGFQEQINEGIAEYFDNDPPFFELPSGGQSGQALLSDGADGAVWGEAQGGGGSGITDEAKTALLACFRNVAWINDQGQTYYDALYAALYPPADLVSIRAAFNQGSAVIYDTDSLDTLKQYLTVTAIMSDSTTRTVTNYTLSGTLTKGTSVITVLYGGKSTTFTVEVYSNRIVFQSGISRSGVTGKLESAENRTSSEMIPISDSTITHNVVCKVNGENTSVYIRCFDQNGLAANVDSTIPVGASALSVVIPSAITNETISLTIDGVEYPCSLGAISEFSNTVSVKIYNKGINWQTGQEEENAARVITDFISVYPHTDRYSPVVAFDLTSNIGAYFKVYEYTDTAFLPNDSLGTNMDSNTVSGNVASTCTRIRIAFKKTDNSDFTQSDIDALTLNNYGMVTYALEEV